ncbi:MAG: gliding motility-associated C-terminal domain-containing protein [Saprospiraceae bacterium]|nr:gliding motility-associated C-terminal domain-containing protein [Saprospiraceae bacterium]
MPEDICTPVLSDECTSTIPNVITPGLVDGANDLFDPIAHLEACAGGFIDPEAVEFTVVNRWGNAVFRAKPYKPWDGRNKDATMPQGAYYYILQIGREKEGRIRGPINLIR